MAVHKIPVIPGDGIGPEIIAEGKKVIEAVGDIDGFSINWLDLPYGSDHYLKTGELINDSSVNGCTPSYTLSSNLMVGKPAILAVVHFSTWASQSTFSNSIISSYILFSIIFVVKTMRSEKYCIFQSAEL